MPDGPTEDRGTPLLPGKWAMLAAFWGVQALVVAALGLTWGATDPGTVNGEKVLYGPVSWARLTSLASEPEAWALIGITAGAITLAQAMLVLPVRRPRARSQRGWPVMLSVASAAAGITALIVAGMFALGSLEEIADFRYPWPSWFLSAQGVWIAAWTAGVWALSGVLLWRFTRRRLDAGVRHEDLLARVAARLFMGTMVEVLAVMPLDVMVRRKTDCYCFAGTFLAMILCGAVGLVVLGPALLLPVLSRRRKRWYAGRCDACGYDLAGLVGSARTLERCPECGAGWRGE